jgi:hypothetical protein
MTFDDGELDLHGNSKTGVIAQQRVREAVGAAQGLARYIGPGP